MGIYEEAYAHPDLAEAIAAKDCHELARILSIGRTKAAHVPLSDVQAKLQSTGAWWAIKPIAANAAHPANMAAIAVTDVANARYENLDTTLPIVAQMFGALVQAGAMAQSVVDSIMELANVPDPLTAQDIAEALFNPDGTPK